MYKYRVTREAGRVISDLLASFDTFEAAERYVLDKGAVYYERDADHDGCADALLRSGFVVSINRVRA